MGWERATNDLRFAGDEVQVWGWSVAGGIEDLTRIQAVLSGDEIVRMQAFRFAPDAERYARSRAGLRQILGRYLGTAPEAVRFAYAEHGKPALAEGQMRIDFNLSHTQGIAVAAFSVAGPVGIDAEELRPVSRRLGDQMFSTWELAALHPVSDEQYTLAFFNGWTRKEAICKAEGNGLQLPTKEFSVSLLPGEEARVLDTGGVLSCEWRLIELPLGKRIAGSLAILPFRSSVRLFQLEGTESPSVESDLSRSASAKP